MNGALAPFVRSTLDLPDRATFVAQTMRDHPTVTRREAIKQYRRLERDEIWLNDEYQVNIDRAPAHGFGPAVAIWHLSIKRRDKAAIHDWRDLQAIKNQLAGPEYEAIELYPAESRLVDTANQFHLWVIVEAKTGAPVPVQLGWTTRTTLGVSHGGAVQRPFHDGRIE